MKLFKATATVAGLTGLSRIAGFVRDILTAAILGAGPVADAFFVALKLPNLFRRVTAEGAFSVSFVPMYNDAMSHEGQDGADRFASEAMSFMILALVIFTSLALMAMPLVIMLIAPGFAGDEIRYELAVDLSRITFPYLLCMSLTALMGGILNSHERFAPFAAAPILFNITLIGFLLFSGSFETAGHALSWGVFSAGFFQMFLLWVFIRKHSISLKIRKPSLTIKVRKLLKLMGPGVVGAGVMHINLLADLIIASFLATGSISYLYYADRLNQLPLGIVGIAIGTALLPMLSRAIAEGEAEKARSLFNRSLEMCCLLSFPAATGLFIISFPAVTTLFQHGAFTMEDAAMTTFVLTAYVVGMPAYIAVKIYSTAYWARFDTVTPVKASVAATIFNIAMSLYLVLGLEIGVVGIAIGTAMSGWLQYIILLRGLKGIPETRFDNRIKKSFFKIFLSCVVMALYLHVVKSGMLDLYLQDDTSLVSQVSGLLILVVGGMVVYGGMIFLTRTISVSEVKKVFKRG
jgi:putative peptidoglycan lipid II flippase